MHINIPHNVDGRQRNIIFDQYFSTTTLALSSHLQNVKYIMIFLPSLADCAIDTRYSSSYVTGNIENDE